MKNSGMLLENSDGKHHNLCADGHAPDEMPDFLLGRHAILGSQFITIWNV